MLETSFSDLKHEDYVIQYIWTLQELNFQHEQNQRLTSTKWKDRNCIKQNPMAEITS